MCASSPPSMTRVPRRADWARLPREIADQIFQYLLYLPSIDPQIAHTSPYYATYYYSYTGTACHTVLRYMLVCHSWRVSVEDVVIKSNDVADILAALPEPLCRKALQRFFSRTYCSARAAPSGRFVQHITTRGLVSCMSMLIEGYNRWFAGLSLLKDGDTDDETNDKLREKRHLSRTYQRHLGDAIQNSQPEMVGLLVQAGATPCHSNSPFSSYDLLQFLVAPGLLPGHPRTPTPEEKAFHEKKVGGPRRLEILRVILDGIGPVDGARYQTYRHPLALAVSFCEFEAAKILVQYGVVPDNDGIMADIKQTLIKSSTMNKDPELKRLVEELRRT